MLCQCRKKTRKRKRKRKTGLSENSKIQTHTLCSYSRLAFGRLSSTHTETLYASEHFKPPPQLTCYAKKDPNKLQWKLIMNSFS